jgi:lipoprotein signal peptidase
LTESPNPALQAFAPDEASPLRDRVRIWPLLTAAGSLIAFGIFQSYSPLAVVFFIPLVGIVGLVALVLAAMAAASSRWWGAASTMILPVIIAATIGNSPTILSPFARFGDYLHLEINRASYEAKIETFKQPVGQRYYDVIWDGFLGNLTILIYDETDRIADSITAEDEQRMGLFATKCAGRVTHITGHYYRCDLSL